MNPSPGEIRDGWITHAMKPAGVAKKGNTSPVTAVLDYPEYSTEAGRNLPGTPGNDNEWVTAQAGAGANLVLPATGFGTPAGKPITPVVKVLTASQLREEVPYSIDSDAVVVISGQRTLQQTGQEILLCEIQFESGVTRTKAELSVPSDFIPRKRGVSL